MNNNEPNENDIFFTDKKEFMRFLQEFAYWNFLISMDSEVVQVEGLKEQLIEESMQASIPHTQQFIDELDECLPFDELEKILKPYVHLVDDCQDEQVYLIQEKNLNEIIQSSSMSIFYKTANSLVDKGLYELVWDKEKEDFTYRAKK